MSQANIGDSKTVSSDAVQKSDVSTTVEAASRPQTPPSAVEQTAFPEGGFAAWSTVAGAYVVICSDFATDSGVTPL